MKKMLFLLLIVIINLKTYSQITFEKGYFINNSEQRIECLIKNIDWRNNPADFDYKISENDEPINTGLRYVKEFGIYNVSKYVRKNVKIDKSNENIEDLNYERNPVFVQEELFLKVLIEGKSCLYSYEAKDFKKFFYSKDDFNIEQLVYKSYLNSVKEIAKNMLFKQQLWNELKCSTIDKERVEKLEYEKNSLMNFFVECNKCNDSNYTNYEEKVKRDLFNLTFRAHFNRSSLSIQNTTSIYNIDFGNKLVFGFGVEAELIFPFNKNKWSISTEPTYQSFEQQKKVDLTDTYRIKYTTSIDYNSIEVPLTLRHYFFLNNNSKIFVNASYIINFDLKSYVNYRRELDNYSFINLDDIRTGNNWGFGVGYKFKDKYSLEMRYQTSRNIFGNYVFWGSDYNKASIIFGYSLF